MIKREDVICLLENMSDKDFATLLQAVETSQANEEKTRFDFKNANLSRVTVQQYHDAELRWKIAYQKRLTDLSAFYEVFSGKSKQFNGRSFVRREKLTGKIVERDGNIYIDYGAVGNGKESEKVLQNGDVVELELNGVFVKTKIATSASVEKWCAVGLPGLKIVGRQARI